MKSLLILLALATASVASAQLTVTVQAPSALAVSIQSSATDQASLTAIYPFAPTLVAGGITFDLVPNFNIGDIVVGSGFLGSFFADISYVGKESIDFNSLGVSDGVTNTLLYNPYSSASKSTSFHITAPTYTEADFYHIDGLMGGLVWEDNPVHFVTYESVNVAANKIYDILGIDDRGTQYIDFNDGVFLLERNLNPVGFTPVPEPSTYAVCGGLVLLGLIAYRKLRQDNFSAAIRE